MIESLCGDMNTGADFSFGLYIHWPFCVSKCPYCDFNSHVRKSIDESVWQKALLQELDYVGLLTKGRQLKSVFFGGGTPSLMPPSLVQALIDKLSDYWVLDPALEITLEANPGSVEQAKFKDFKAAGVNRISLGVQALDQKALTFLGRQHTVQEAYKALETIAHTFSRYSFDLIYARPGQTVQEWEAELTHALSLAKGHLSLYQLTIEKGTAFYQAHARGDWQIPHPPLAADFYELTQKLMETHDMPAYEISNHACVGQECQHNLIYWRGGDYAAIGPGAHGRLTLQDKRFAMAQYKAPETWLKTVQSCGHGTQIKEELCPQEMFLELLIMGLRLSQGVSIAHLHAIDHILATQLLTGTPLKNLIEEGLMAKNPTHIHATSQGLQRLDSVLQYLVGS